MNSDAKCSDCGGPDGKMRTAYGVELRVLCAMCAARASDDLQCDKAEQLRLSALSKRQAQNGPVEQLRVT